VTEVWAGTCCQTEQTEAADPAAVGGLPTAEVLAEVSAGVWLWELHYRRQ